MPIVCRKMDMSIVEKLKSLFVSKPSEVDRSNAAFQSASDAFDRAFSTCEPYGTLAFSRSSNEGDVDHYTIGELNEHSHAVTALAEAFAPLIASVSSYHGPETLRTSARELLLVYAKMFRLAAEGLSAAAQCACTTALRGQLEAAKMEFEVFSLRRGLGEDASHDEIVEVEEMERSISQIAAHFSALETRAKSAEALAQQLRARAERVIGVRA
jgi:hypothetical protein